MRETTDKQIRRLQSGYQQIHRETWGNDRLTEETKRREVREAHAVAAKEITRLRTEERAWTESRRDELHRKTFGIPTAYGQPTGDPLPYRMAAEAVEAATSADKLHGLMVRAQRMGDTALLKTAAGAAWDRSQQEVGGRAYAEMVDAYIEAVPASKDQLQELYDLSQSDGLAQSMAYSLSNPDTQPMAGVRWSPPIGNPADHDTSTPVRMAG